MVSISWNRDMLARFKLAHKAALDAKEDSFEFDGHQFLTSYAGYLIEYLTGKLQ